MIRTQTIIIGICIIITLLLAISNLFIPTNNQDKQSIFTRTKFYLLLVMLLVIFPLAIVHLYAVNCMLEGNCELFTWIIAALVIISTILYTGGFIYRLVKLKKTITSEEKHI